MMVSRPLWVSMAIIALGVPVVAGSLPCIMYLSVPGGLACLLAGGLMVVTGVRDLFAWRRRRSRLAADSGRPWRADRRWPRGFVLDAREGSKVGGLWVVLCLWFLILGPVAVHILPKETSPVPWLIFAFLAGVGIFLAGFVLVRTLRYARYGSARVLLEELPIVPGRVMRAVVPVRRRLDARNALQAKLRCHVNSDRDGAEGSAVARDLAADISAGCPGDASGSGTAMAVRIAVPEDAAPTTPPGQDPEVIWTLKVGAGSGLLRFEAEFDLPVFRVADEGLIKKRPEDAGR